ncbi:M23 family metallopeptidase [uncultured Polaribacter sp.]|uniref:M23 family metallopeptidase n=1 Tax=uncultured Polaribacter sp. TaxID=174711 RepID=UPI0026017508|nr:M23 family metallopeptidase [uncultured Polaribacter sp.]
MKQFTITFILITSLFCNAQKKYPQNYFRKPLNIPIILSGSFGELRSNHFHSGLDIKTQGKEGLSIYSSADGYVSRIVVKQYGFGKAIYITHPNGYTTVYGHLSKFNKEIEAYVKSIQYKKENYTTGNLYFKEDKFPVNKGDVIAFSGDTGGSGGPHLHYEIRSTKNETNRIFNPLLFGLKVEDTTQPAIQSLKVYALDHNSRINKQKKSFIIPLKKNKEGTFLAERITANGNIGFAVNVFDRFNKAPNKNGIYSLEMLVNGKRTYYHDVETFTFSESKFINLHIDYEHYKTYRKKYQKTHKVAANKLSTYNDLVNDGRINVKKGLNYYVEIIARDFAGNASRIKISVSGKENNSIFDAQKDTTAYKILANKFNKFTQNDVTIAFPKNTFYKDVYLDFKVKNGIAKIHKPIIPLDKKFTLTFNVSKYTEKEKKQLYIANVENKKYPRYQLTTKKDSTFYTTTKTLGKYSLLSDNKKPTIKILYFKDKQDISKLKTLKVKIDDIGSGIKNFRATIDGEWILMEYNHKKKILTYNFSDKKLVGNKHIFNLVVSDNVGNTKEVTTTFFKKEIN